jgi:methyltransferase-like protein
VLREEAKRMSRMPASYILGEFLAECNAPATFSDFTGLAEGHGLRFLCEADLNADANELITPEARRDLDQIGDTDRNEAEQRLDLFSGRPFRRSLLVKAATARSHNTSRSESLKGLHITSRLTPDLERTKDRTVAFTDGRGRPVATQTPLIGRALTRLADACPATTPVDTLVDDGPEGARVAKVLLRLLNEGRAKVSTLPLAVGRATDVRPVAWAIARAEAASGQPFVTGLSHVAVELPRGMAALLAQLDGTHDREDLIQWTAQAIPAGVISLSGRDPCSNDTAPLAVARAHVEETLRHLAMGAVLLPASTS